MEQEGFSREMILYYYRNINQMLSLTGQIMCGSDTRSINYLRLNTKLLRHNVGKVENNFLKL